MNGLRGGIAALVLATSSAHATVDPIALWYEQVRDGEGTEMSQRAEVHCLALNIYHEARGETFEGKLAVAAVTLNRVRHKRFPDGVCEVVWQPRQFSWTHDGKTDRPYNQKAWELAPGPRTPWATSIRLVRQSTSMRSTAARPTGAVDSRRSAKSGGTSFTRASSLSDLERAENESVKNAKQSRSHARSA